MAKFAEELEQQKVLSQAVTSENLKIRREFKQRVAELNEKLISARLIEEQVVKIGEGVKMWQDRKNGGEEIHPTGQESRHNRIGK